MHRVKLSWPERARLMYQRSILIRLMSWCMVVLFAGSFVLYLAEHDEPGTEYGSYFQTIENIVILFTSGFDAGKPQSFIGKGIAFLILGCGICFLGLFTGEIAAFLVERRMKGSQGMKPVKFSNHIIITRWSKDTEAIIDELMSEEIKERRNIVVIDRELHELPIDNPYVEFIKGDPTESAVLERAGVLRANTAIILADASSKDYNIEDSRNILVCLAVESLNKNVYTVVQILNPENQKHLERANCDEIICTTEVSTRLVVQSSLNHGLSKFFGDVLSFGEGSEIYRIRLAKRYVRKEYFELGAELMMKHRISLLALQQGAEMYINPEKSIQVKEGDHAFVLSPDHPKVLED